MRLRVLLAFHHWGPSSRLPLAEKADDPVGLVFTTAIGGFPVWLLSGPSHGDGFRAGALSLDRATVQPSETTG